jgi:hypothetical protein
MSRRFTLILEDEVYEELDELANLLSVPMGELLRRGADRLLGRDGSPAGVWRLRPGFAPRRAGVKFQK